MREHPLRLDRMWQIWVELVFITICHDANWYRVHSSVLEVADCDIDVLHPKRLADLTSTSFRSLFGKAYDDNNLRAGERCKLLRMIGAEVHDWPAPTRTEWLEKEKASLSGEHGLYRRVDGLSPFGQDPLRKKSRILAHQLMRYELIDVADAEMLLPAIDYHLIRFYVRTGRIFQEQDEMSERLSGDGNQSVARIEYLTHLRRAVEEAMWYTAAGADLRMDHLNHVEWQLARSFCVRSRARCFEHPLASKPIDREVSILSASSEGHCPLASSCRGSTDETLRSLIEPRSARAFY